MKSNRTKDQLHAYLSGNLSEADTKAFEKEMRNNPELNHQMNQKREKQQQKSYSVKEPNKNHKRNYWLPIIVLSVSALFAMQYFSDSQNDKVIPKANGNQQESSLSETNVPASYNATREKANTSTKGTSANNRPKGTQSSDQPVIVKSIAQYKSGAEKENIKTASFGAEYLMLLRQLYSASDYPTGEKLLSSARIANQNFYAGITAYVEGKNMKEAILNFQKINRSKEREDYELAKPYLAHAYFKIGDYGKAKSLFTDLSRSSDSKVKEDAEWFLTLSLLPDYKEQKEAVNVLLQKMLKKENKHRHVKDAEYLKEDLAKIANF